MEIKPNGDFWKWTAGITITVLISVLSVLLMGVYEHTQSIGHPPLQTKVDANSSEIEGLQHSQDRYFQILLEEVRELRKLVNEAIMQYHAQRDD